MTTRPLAVLGALALLAVLPACAQQEPDTPAGRRVHLRELLGAGRYDEAVAKARRWTAAGDGALETSLGEALRLTGQLAAAESAFTRARGADRVTAEVALGQLAEGRGDLTGARARFLAAEQAMTRLPRAATADDYVALGTAYRHLGRENAGYFRRALEAYDRALALDSSHQEARVLVGELFLEKYNGPDAAASFREVLAIQPDHARANLGMARHAVFDGTADPRPFLDKALAANPRLVPAIVLRARLLLDREDYSAAEREARKALEVHSSDGAALAVLAASQWLRGDESFAKTRARALEVNPRDAEFFADLAEAAGRNRRYREAAAFAAEGMALDSLHWRSVGLLGINQLRTGAVGKGRAHLDRAFAADPFHVWHKNTLDLLDQLARFQVYRSPRFEIHADSSEARLLLPYAAALAEEAFDTLAARYAWRPATPIRLEIYRSHADFSVRTVGLAGLGALGVSFGNVLAMDSPWARERGSFNWGSTLWHEIGHTFTLGITNHRVPRWLSEGLSVLEERRARPGWGANVTLGFLAALKAGRLLPVSQLNDGFVRPSYPGHIAHSYFQASLVCAFIAERWGDGAILGLLRAYGDGATQEEATRRALDLEPAVLDRDFERWIKTRYARELAAVSSAPPDGDAPAAPRVGRPVPTSDVNAGDFLGNLQAGRFLFEQGAREQAAPFLERAKALFPDYAEADSPYWYLAQIAKDGGDRGRATAELRELTRRNESAWEPHAQLASLLEQSGDHAGAAGALERMIWIQPGDPSIHARLAGLYGTLGRHVLAVRERRAVLATDPTDRADAEYRLARALQAAGDRAGARAAVLRALEIAPGYDEALALLLELRRGGGA